MKRSSSKKAAKPNGPPTPVLASRFVAAPGAQFDDEQADIYGRELARIAEQNRVGDIRSLDKHLVYQEVEQNEESPLRPFVFHSSDSDAARSHRIDRCSLLIRSVRIVTVGLGPRPIPQPMFLTVPDNVKRGLSNGDSRLRSRVVLSDVIGNDPAFSSAITLQVRNIEFAVARLEHITQLRGAPEAVIRLRDGMRRSLDEYRASFVTDAAAE